MLLRNTSSSAFESLLPVYPQPEFFSEASENEAKFMHESARSLSFSRSSQACGNLTSPRVQNLCRREVFSGDEIDRDVDREVAFWPRIEKVFSENDLHNRYLGLASPARVAASSLLSHRRSTAAFDFNDNPEKSWSRPRFSRTQSFVTSVSSVYFGASGLDRHDFIPEADVGTRIESAAPADAAGPERRGVFDRISIEVDELKERPAFGYGEGSDNLQYSPSGRVLEVRGGEVGVKQSSERTPSYVQSRARESDARVLDGKVRGVASGREEERRRPQSSALAKVRAKGESVACDLRGCRPTRQEDDAHPNQICEGGDSRGGGGRFSGTCTGGSGPGSYSDPTDLYYREMLEENPGHPLLLRNYAQYLAEVKRDYVKAEEYCQRAILANPSDGEMLVQYAKLIWDIQRDYERASSYFERAVQAAPDNSYVMGAYACFVWNAEEDDPEEEGTGNPFPSMPSLVAASCR